MFKAIAAAVLALLIAALLPGGALAQTDNDPDDKASLRNICADRLLECVVECTWYDGDENFSICNQDCNEDYGICVRAVDEARVGGGAGVEGGADGGFEPPNRNNDHVVAVGLVGAAQVERACTRVNGVSSRTTPVVYGCVNQLCDGKGNCAIACFGGKCFAVTPGKLADKLTLLGILQNGDNVDRGGGGSGGGSLVGGKGGEGCANMDGGICYP